MDQNPYQSSSYSASYSQQQGNVKPKHSGLGVASFVLSVLSFVAMVVLIVVAGIIETSTPGGIPDDSPITMVIGLMYFVLLFVMLIAIALGISGLVQKDKKKVFAVLGLIFSMLLMIGSVGLLVWGLLAEENEQQLIDGLPPVQAEKI